MSRQARARLDTWTLLIIGIAVSVLLAGALTIYIPRLYPARFGEGAR